MALFPQDGDGRARGRADAAGGAGHAPATSWCGLPTKVLATGRARAPRRLRHG
jgi:hypothetical protein